MANEATGSSVKPNGPKPCSFVGSRYIFYCSERYTLPLKITPGCRIACSEDKLVVRILAGETRAPIVFHVLFSRTACFVAVSGRLVERASYRLDLSSFPSFLAPERCQTTRVLILSFALGRCPRDAGFLAVPWVAAVVAVDGAVAFPGQMHGNPTTHDRGRVIRAGEAVDVQGTHHASNVCEVEIPPFIAGSTDPLVLGGKGLKNDVFVPLVGYWLAHILQTLAIAVHSVQKIVGIIAGLHLGIEQIFVVPFVLLLYFFSRAFHAACPLPTPSSRVLSMCFFTTLWAERSVVKNKMPKRFSFARVHVVRAGELCAVISFGSPLRMAATLCQWNDRLTRSLSLYSKRWILSLPSKRGYKFTIAWMLSVSCSAMITPSDVPYTSSDSDALCLVPDAHRCSAVDVKSYVPYFPSGRSALCVVGGTHRYSAVGVESYVPYFPSGRNALCVVRDAHRCSAVVVNSYVPYFPSDRNALCVVRDARTVTVPSFLKVTCLASLQAAMHCV